MIEGNFFQEILNNIPKFEVGMKFEVKNTIYPDDKIDEQIKNIGNKFTKPLAISAKDKLKIRQREDDVLLDFLSFKNCKREKGDILVVKEVKNGIALCENISRPETIKQYYEHESIKFVKISIRDVLESNIKKIERFRSI